MLFWKTKIFKKPTATIPWAFLFMNLYKKYQLMREEILKHKWIESEKQNKDVGFEYALIDWTKKHRKNGRNK